jgi:hypothetical protein
MSKRRLVIYSDGYGWEGSLEITTGYWPFKKIQYAPITHADTALEVFTWLLEKYPYYVIAYHPAVSEDVV